MASEEIVLTKLVEDLDYRKQHLEKRNTAYLLKEVDSRWLLEFSYPHILMGLERRSTLVDLCSSMGKRVMQKLKLKQDSMKAVHTGFYILISYFETGIIEYYSARVKGNPRNKHTTYQLRVKDWDSLRSLIDVVDDAVSDLFPSITPVAPWDGSDYHTDTGRPLIRHAHSKTTAQIKEGGLEFLTETLNKLNDTGWRINQFTFDVYKKCMTLEKNPFKFSKEIDPIKRTSLIVETQAIEKLAERNLNNAFYHLYNCDFRGRIYPNTAYLHEQSSDNAKGILLLDEPVSLGENGYYWLRVHTANVWGNDKITLDERAKWTLDSLEEILLYVDNPIKNTGWMEADKPFSFLSACNELSMLSNWHGDGYKTEDFPSCLPIYIDGSNNGVQHLAAMSLDETVAPLVNLVPQELPGDVYMFIADHVMNNLEKKVKELDPKVVKKFPKHYKKICEMQREMEKWPSGTEKYKLAVRKYKEYKNHNYDLNKAVWPVFWNNIKDRKIWRKTVKRPVMTLGYGGTAYGMGEQVNDDTRSINEYLRDKEMVWSVGLGHFIHKTCYEELKGPAELLKMFQNLAERQNDLDVPVEYRLPVTNFPMIHKYKEAKVRRADLKYGEDLLKVRVNVWEEATLKKSKQKSSTAPNVVHSLDAVHLAMIVHGADYNVTVVHDSFGCHAGNMEHMFKHTRQMFVDLYALNPLEYVLSQMDSLDLIPQKGNLNVSEITKSDFAFA
jgi:DNA-directed RNA polymerase